MDENELFENNPVFLDMIVDRMLQSLNSLEKFIFLYVFILGRSETSAGELLHIHKTNICRRVKTIRKKLIWYKSGYVNTEKDISNNKEYGKPTNYAS